LRPDGLAMKKRLKFIFVFLFDVKREEFDVATHEVLKPQMLD
jgi:hypothetical protein